MTENELARGGTSGDDHPSRQGGDRHLVGLFVSRDGAPARRRLELQRANSPDPGP